MQAILRTTVAILISTLSQSAWAKCNPDGVAHEVIECIEEDNEANARKLGPDWEKQYKKFIEKCRKEFPGGGSGGRADRAECVSKKVEKALKG